MQLVVVTASTNAIPWRDGFEPAAEGFLGVTVTNLSPKFGANGRAGVNIAFARSPVSNVGRVAWAQSGRLLSGTEVHLESGEVRSKDLQTVDSQAVTRAFTTSVERRTIGVTLVFSGDFDNKGWWITADLEARTDRGGERLFKSKLKAHVLPGRWEPMAELSREDFEQVIKALPGGWWKSKGHNKADEKYILGIRIDPLSQVEKAKLYE